MELAGVILLGPDGKVLATNSAAKVMLSLRDGLKVRDGHLENEALKTAFVACSQPSITRVARPSGLSPWLIWATPLINGDLTPSYCAISIFDSAQRQKSVRALLSAALRLTRAELDLAEQLILGRNPKDAAAALNVTIHTVRTYLKRLFKKTGVHSQSGLVGKLLEIVHALPVIP